MTSPETSPEDTDTRSNFIYDIIDEDLEDGTYGDRVWTRFPPEPNGYLHIGHAKSIVLNFGIKHDYADVADTQCHLRFDDTNPETESEEYAESIKDAVHWLGYDWEEHEYYASDYFEQFYQYAVKLIKDGKAYVDSLSEEEIREYRGTVNEPGKPSPYRDRSVEENLNLFERMRAGEFEDGEHVLRAKIDMSSPHMILRDPPLFRIKHADHYRQGDDWCIYPMYDFAHPLEDAIEDITHSLCTLEFENNRRVYDWVLENCLDPDEVSSRPHQYEFARLNLGYTVMSKRKLRQLVEDGTVEGWDDPRLPTIMGLRRRGVTPSAVRSFCREIGVTRKQSRVEISRFEHAIRDDLNEKAPRVMAVLRPLKVTITNYPEDQTEWLEADYWPRDIDKHETRDVPFSRTLFIERSDFQEDPDEDFIRLAPGREVRLRHGYFLTCEDVIKDEDGTVVELRCTIDPETRDSTAPDGRSPSATIHWVSANHAIPFEGRLYERLFRIPAPDEQDEDFTHYLNPDSLITLEGVIEPSIVDDPADTRYQFERQGYFWQDPEDSSLDELVFNQIVPLYDQWAKIEQEREKKAMEKRRREKQKRKELQRKRSMEAQRDPVEELTRSQRVRFDRYQDAFSLDRRDAALLAGDDNLAAFYETVLDHYEEPESVANWIINELMRALKDMSLGDLPFGAEEFAQLVQLVDKGVVSSQGGQQVLETMVEQGGAPEEIVDELDLRQIDDASELETIVEDVIDSNTSEVERYRSGEKRLLGFFMGEVMRATDGTANPDLARKLLQEGLET